MYARFLSVRNPLLETGGPDLQKSRNLGRRFCMNESSKETFDVVLTRMNLKERSKYSSL